MVFSRNADGVFESDPLKSIPGVSHGFGSRLSPEWPGSYLGLKQIHSTQVAVVREPGASPGEGDAIVSDLAGVMIGIRTADCVPILLVDSGRRAVGAVHAGWRGTAGAITRGAVEHMVESFGSDPSHLYAAIGPSIGSCCFEVGPEVLKEFAGYERVVRGRYVDLIEANYVQLLDAGVRAERIDRAHLCTTCEAEQFHSFRRDKAEAGRMVAAIRIDS